MGVFELVFLFICIFVLWVEGVEVLIGMLNLFILM